MNLTRYSLRTLFVVLTCMALCAWQAYRLRVAYESERRAVAELRDRGIQVRTELQPPCGLPGNWGLWQQAVTVTCRDYPSDADLNAMTDLPKLECIRLEGSLIDDVAVRRISGLHGVGTLLIRDSRVTDCGLTALRGMRLERLTIYNNVNIRGHGLNWLANSRLHRLNADRTPINDDGLRAISSASTLRTLIIASNDITDDGIGWLTNLRELEDLQLYGDRLTDQGLLKLATSPSIERLYCGGIGITTRGRKELQRLRPDIRYGSGIGGIIEGDQISLD